MKLLIIRHGDPDYSIDSLTPAGWKEAQLLSRRLEKLDIKAFYCSPMGRARDTASFTLQAMNREAEVLPWLREFPPQILKEGREGPSVVWDWLPRIWKEEPAFFDHQNWMNPEIFQQAKVPEVYKSVTDGLDALLHRHGYDRQGYHYRATNANEDTVVLFCHFGLECVLLSHLLHISPMVLWHGTCAAPTSVTTLVTEERREGIASWRMSAFGDISHLYAGNQPPAFAARFCECFRNEDQRHD